ncbi:ribosome small subunit-dependent GTPase A [Rhodobacteraceae bacterium CCMM004]|nr:ribosome small subunit-dependent GTPase A [Rhodobacteraceae bacterium CCMM004]
MLPKASPTDLAAAGWSQFFTAQLDATDLDPLHPARVTAVHRSSLDVAVPCAAPPGALAPGLTHLTVPPLPPTDDPEDAATVGDWLLLDADGTTALRRLDRLSLFKRRAPGTELRVQLIAANVDTAFLVSTCTQDFNIARLERYLVLVRDAGALPVVVLTKADLAPDPDGVAARARAALRGVPVEAVTAPDPATVGVLAPWLGRGQTVALLGSSGVGKSTLANTLGGLGIATSGTRKGDGKGRHTTTTRQLHPLPGGAWLLDTPGMRELSLADVAAGLEAVFDDIADLAQDCRFADCAHDGEPGCAVADAVAAGRLDPARLARWRKLSAEDAHNSRSLVERRRGAKVFGRMVREAKEMKRRDRF